MEARRMRQRIAERMFNEASEPVRVGRFELIESIGSGGMGVVFSARDHRLERRVAIKILHDFTADRIGRERLLQEAKALAQVSHPNVVQVFEVGEHEGRVYVAMEYVQGSSLRQWRIRGERPWAEVLSLYMDAAKGLVAVHEAGLVHRDFKPANVMLGDDGRVRVADFGLARTPLTEDSAGGLASAPSHTVTIEGRVAGTPAYMPPEQRLGGEVDVRSDQFAWCTCVWEGLFGSRPYDDVSPSRSHAPVLPAPPSGLVPSYVVDVLRRGLSWDPAGRWPDMRALLDAFAKGSRRRSAGRGVLLVGMVGILAAAGGAWLARPDRCAAPTEAIAAIWSLGTAQALTSGLHANAPEFATKAAHAAAHRFDTFADQWLATHVEVCEAATELRRTSPVRRQLVEACLEQRLQRFGTMVDALTPMSAANAVGADRLTTSLRTPMECLKLKPELLNAAPSPRGEEIARAHALLELGSTAAAAQLAQRISEEVEDADPQGQAEAELIVGRAHAELGEGRKAAKHLLRAIDVGEAARLDLLVARAWIEVTVVGALRLKDLALATAWAARASAAWRRVGAPHELGARLSLAEAEVALLRGDTEQARSALDRAASHAATLAERGAAPRERLQIMRGHAEADAGNLAAARAAYEAGRAAIGNRLGADHPELAKSELNLALLARALEDPKRAQQHLDAAHALLERALGPDSPRLAPVLVAQTEILLARNHLEEARRVANRAYELQQRLPQAHPDRGGALILLCELEVLAGNDKAAADHARTLARSWEKHPFASRRLEAMNNAAYYSLRAGDVDAGRRWARALVDSAQPGSTLHLYGLAYLGRALVDGGEPRRGLFILEDLLDRTTEANPQTIDLFGAELRRSVARGLIALGRTEDRGRARDLLREAAPAFSDDPSIASHVAHELHALADE